MRARAFLLLFSALLIAATAVCFAGCGDKSAPAATLELRSNAIAGGELAVPKDKSVIVGIVGRDDKGAEVKLNLADITITSTDEKVAGVKLLGDAFLVTGLRDWFDSPKDPDAGDGAGGASGDQADAGTTPPPADPADAGADGAGGSGEGGAPPADIYGAEPTATVTVTYGGATATLSVKVILNVAGTWRVIIDDKATQELQLDQQGRGILYSGTSGDASGSVNGDKFTLSQQGITLDGTFSSRTEAAGTYSGLASGSWKAQKQP